jgi:hypothetical protein
MRKHLTSLALAGLLGIVAVVMSTEAGAARSFDEGDLDGEYVGVATGGVLLQGPGLVPVAYLIRIVADGAGNLTFEAWRNIAASFTTVNENCTYSIEARGFGTVTCVSLNLRILLSNGGRQLDLITPNNTDQIVIGGHLIRQ